jgi:hypothetical protein
MLLYTHLYDMPNVNLVAKKRAFARFYLNAILIKLVVNVWSFASELAIQSFT